jgi:hypothetical protein
VAAAGEKGRFFFLSVQALCIIHISTMGVIKEAIALDYLDITVDAVIIYDNDQT